ncbi:MAG: class A beta-lactamase-related serine hydrolase [Desulfobacteraceae bacterium]|nr:MAG: class A beta-lactamase-related serine hydrolase [Desulfobacteraceae bacterium]
MTDITLCGHCDPRFTELRNVFQHHFKSGRELGAAVAVTLDGRAVVDLWAGYADHKRSRPWQKDTLVNVYSTTKGFTAACVHRLADQGRLDLDDPVAHYWPEFARNGKETITLRHLLSHQAGLPAISAPLPAEAVFDWDKMTRALAEQAPWWTPGTRHGYHARTYGWLLGEVVRRITGKRLGLFFHDEIAAPLGLDFHIGLSEQHHYRVAPIGKIPPPPPGANPNLGHIMLTQPEAVTTKAFTNPPIHKIPDLVNTARWRSAEIPSSNGHGTAAAIARFYGALACGGRLDGVQVLSKHSIEAARKEHAHGPDEVLKVDTRFGLGYMLPQPGAALGPNGYAFGHPGMGGSLGFADPEARIGFGYVMNRPQDSILIDDRPAALIEALYAAVV